MARAVISLVIALLGCAGGCAPDLPRYFQIEADFSPAETAFILEAAEKWNDVGREYLGLDRILIFDGRYADANGFDPDDLGDGRDVVYRGLDDENYAFLTADDPEDYTLMGYGTYGDILLFTFTFSTESVIQDICLHEFGHYLGLGHVPDDETAVMYGRYSSLTGRRPNCTDILAFCAVHDCLRAP